MVFKKIIVTNLVGLISASSVHACSLPSNWDQIRDVPVKEEVVVLLGTVKSLGVKVFEDKKCLLIKYSNVKIITGKAVGPYDVATCFSYEVDEKELSLLKDPMDEGNRLGGFFKGAYVLSHITKQKLNIDASLHLEPPEGFFRPLQINCWGIFQINIKEIPLTDRQKYIDNLMKDFKNNWFKS